LTDFWGKCDKKTFLFNAFWNKATKIIKFRGKTDYDQKRFYYKSVSICRNVGSLTIKTKIPESWGNPKANSSLDSIEKKINCAKKLLEFQLNRRLLLRICRTTATDKAFQFSINSHFNILRCGYFV
jgi:hypothetical protein